jgi:hypothetical protein
MTTPTPSAVHAKRIGPTLVPNRSRVLMRPFRPTTDAIARRIVTQVMALSETDVARLLDSVMAEFGDRHPAVEKFFQNRFNKVRYLIAGRRKVSSKRRLLIGAYFTHEYSPESAALFNPSIVPHPDQTGLSKGALRFILSLRATGEGHISSITFRMGFVSARHEISLTPPVPFATEPDQVPNAAYDKPLFARKLQELGVQNKFCRQVLEQLNDSFTMKELRRVLPAERLHVDASDAEVSDAAADRAVRGIRLLAESNYEVRFTPRFPSASFFRPRPARATASRTRASSGSRTTAAISPITRPTPPTTEKSSCHNCWRRRIFSISNSLRSMAPPCRTKAWRYFHARSTATMPCSRARTTRTF